ncbi:MAG: F0F1 ATP synthase subunit B [Chromatiales bacterium]|nr:F0F1 ATP synthase subunit B [Chromatiales bacterium]
MEVSLGTLIAQGITFFIFVYVTMKYVWPPIMQAIVDRREKIADGLAAAERGKTELEKAGARVEDLLRDARSQAQEIVEQANRRANSILEEARSEGQKQRDRQLATAQAEIEQEVSKAREELRSQVALIAVAGAERILAREIDAKAHQDLLQQLATEI